MTLSTETAAAGQFTTADEVRPILEATKGTWVALREYDGQDLLYFTHLLAWRCGLEGVRYSINGGAQQVFDAEPCYEDEAQPNAIKATDALPFVRFDLKSVNTVDVQLTYDDGQVADVQFERAGILMN
ncbi:hypothetical protein KKW20_15575 [Planktotalea lamellibrachiae]|nr:hypothetical protein [Aliiroseovarius lamellibrachiae]